MASSEEQLALAQFVMRLGSANCSNEPCLVNETRQDAELLMSLMLSHTSSYNEKAPDIEPVSSSDHSYASDSSSCSRRDFFFFTCPSLSLESPNNTLQHLRSASNSTAARLPSEDGQASPSLPPPAILLGRPLKADDRDALRLSGDAMARNLMQSFEKAMAWRIETWISILAREIAEKEQELVKARASEEEIQMLLQTPQAALVLALRNIADVNRITVHSASTYFEVLNHRVDSIDKMNASSQRSEAGTTKDVHTGIGSPAEQHEGSEASWSEAVKEDDDYNYCVAHQLEFHCELQLQTPAGFSEIKITVPGTIQGSFHSSYLYPNAELRSVVINLDTNILAAIVEKSCRKIVRVSVESIMEVSEEELEQETASSLEASEPNDMDITATTTDATPSLKEPFTLSSPQGNGVSEYVFVTPYRNDSVAESVGERRPRVLVPIPDDFDDDEQLSRRIQPQVVPQGRDALTPPPFAPRSSTKRGSPSTSRVNTTDVKRRLPMISPLAEDPNYHDVPSNGPALPMLVEAACRAKRVG